MAVVTFFNAIGQGGSVRSGDFVVPTSSIVVDPNPLVEWYDYDTIQATYSYNNGQFYVSAFIDYLSGNNYLITDIYVYNSNVNIMSSSRSINIAFNINSNFSEAISFSNMYASADVFSGNDYGDYIEAGAGNDVVSGRFGNDILLGQSGNDKLYGDNNHDTLYGGDNNDKLYGGSGNDKLYGGNNNDKLYGGTGNDKLYGGTGKDVMLGGSGADTFAFVNKSESSAKARKADKIQDFQQGTDVIDLSAIDAFNFNGTTAFGTDSEGEIRYKQFDKAGTKKDFTMVYIDTDSDRGAEMSIKLKGLYTLTEDDFIL